MSFYSQLLVAPIQQVSGYRVSDSRAESIMMYYFHKQHSMASLVPYSAYFLQKKHKKLAYYKEVEYEPYTLY